MVWWWMTILLRILKRVYRGRFNFYNTNPYLVTYNWKGRLTIPQLLLRIGANDTSGQNGQTLAGLTYTPVNGTFVFCYPSDSKWSYSFQWNTLFDDK